MIIVELSSGCRITTIAQKIRETRVEIAAPATPMPKTKIRIAFPPIFKKLERMEIVIGPLVLFCARKMEAPASYRPMNGNDKSVKKK